MTTADSNMSNHLLMSLIYKHLREHGQEEAASVLRKHSPQVETAHAKDSLAKIFNRWISKKQKRNEERKDFQKVGSKRSVSKSKSAKKKAHSGDSTGKTKSKSQIKAAAQNAQSEIQRSTNAPSSEKQTLSPATENDSDSDSSLDVEKWKKVALHLSDAVIAKMDAITNITSMQSKKRSSSSSKFEDQSTKKSKPSTKKPEARIAPSPSEAKTQSKSKTKFKKTAHSSTVATPSKTSEDLNVNLENPDSKTVDSLSDVVTPTTGVANSLSEINNVKSKRVKRKKTESILDVETQNKSVVSENTGNHSELQTIETPSRKKKSNKVKYSLVGDDICTSTPSTKNTSKHVQIVEPVDVGTPKASDGGSASGLITSDFSTTFETSKKVKSKKSHKSIERKGDSDVSSHSKPNRTETNENLTTKETETPTKKVDIQSSHVLFEGDTSEMFTSENSSKKSKSKKSSKSDKEESLSERVSVDTGSMVANSELSISDNLEFSSKKRKRKRFGNPEQIPSSVTASEHDINSPNKVCSNDREAKNITIPEEEDALEKDPSPESKKRKKDKKKRKDKDEPVVEEVPQTSHEQEEQVDTLPSSPKKKKKKKKHREEEISLLCTPAPEEYTSKKKKKSSKEKGHNDADLRLIQRDS